MIQPTNFTKLSRNDYPTSDGRPMAETDLHRDLMHTLIATLRAWFAADPAVYVSGNLLVYYVRGNKRVHVAPDVFVVPRVGNHPRENYLLWEEGGGLDVVIELTSKTTMIEDIEEKYNLYVSKLKVKEYYLFDPKEEYLTPSFQGYRRSRSRFQPIRAVAGRLPSKVLGLHLERDGTQLRFRDPKSGSRVPTPEEIIERNEQTIRKVEEARAASDAKVEQLQREIEELRRKLAGGAGG
ncbi:MAG TPA: Uma2 family endonuclease [Fimbriiglobus sp.]|nr:Uma2 family endonuclease [Fimbriiglobus sp.]